MSASDPDCSVHAQLTYSIAKNLGFQYPNEFFIRNDTGFVCVKEPLDYEKKKAYEFPIEAKDSGRYFSPRCALFWPKKRMAQRQMIRKTG